MAFHLSQQIFDELKETSEKYPPLKHALLVNAKRDPVVIGLRPLFNWLLNQLIRETDYRLRAEQRWAECKKKLREAEDKLEEYRKKPTEGL